MTDKIPARIQRFMEKNKTVPIYKGAWNKDDTKLKYWLEDGTTVTIPANLAPVVRTNWGIK